MAKQETAAAGVKWRTVKYQGRTIRYAVVRRAGKKVVLIKRGK